MTNFTDLHVINMYSMNGCDLFISYFLHIIVCNKSKQKYTQRDVICSANLCWFPGRVYHRSLLQVYIPCLYLHVDCFCQLSSISFSLA